ncbi:MAG: methionine synthase [Anaerolineaceae bacterium]|nr:methionine synthase [Anaerolineaceae bacterium]
MTSENNKKFTNRRYLDAIDQGVVLFDGAMGTNLDRQHLTVEDFGGARTAGCNDYLVITKPSAVEIVHRSFMEAGSDVIETDSFRSNRLTLAEFGLGDRVNEINRAAASLARRVADEFSTPEKPRFVAGSMGPSGKLISTEDPEMSNISFEVLADVFREQAVGLIEGGVDLLLIETSQDILEVKAVIQGIYAAFEETGEVIPIQAQVTLDTTGRMLLGTDIAAARAILEEMGIDVIGLNCSTGPDYMREPIRFLTENSRLPVSCIPNAGLPLNVDGEAVYPMKPQPFADLMLEFVNDYGVRVVGGCCGTSEDHIGLLNEGLNRGHAKPPVPPAEPMLASPVQAVPMHQEPAPFLIGERLNTQGSRKFKRLIMEEDYDGIVEMARAQVDKGAHGLDVCVALTERSDEDQLMRKVVKRLANAVPVPLVIDTTEVDVLEAALESNPGRSLINSTHLESGPEKAGKIFTLAKRFNAAVIVLTIDEDGMAKSADRKAEVAERIYDLAVNEYGLQAEDLVYDDLTFTLATGDPELRDSALQTLEGIRRIKKSFPGVLTSLGVSNVSFGLSRPARAVLNSVMLYHCVEAGLDMAIVNPAHIKPYAEIPEDERKLAEDLIFNRDEQALARLITYFESVEDSGEQESGESDLAEMTPEERLHWRILRRHKADVETDIDILLNRDPERPKGEKAVEILNTVLLPAMKDVGDKFGAGELILPFVLQSAEVMKVAVNYLENFLEKQEGATKGKLVLATVYGDVHDIGKNLVKTILSNNGYTVVDLGKQVPAETIITRAVEEQADAIGLSALLVSTSKQMPLIINELDRRGLDFPVLVGGAAINPRFGKRILLTEAGHYYEPGVFYCKDAFEGLSTMDALMTPDKREVLVDEIRQSADYELGKELHSKRSVPRSVRKNAVTVLDKLPEPPHWGARVVRDMPLEIVGEHLSLNELYRLSWGAKNAHGEEWKSLKTEFEERLVRMRKAAEKEGWLQPQAVYGYWPCQSVGDELLVYNPKTLQDAEPVVIERFAFPRQEGGEGLSLADYFATKESGRMDVVAFQVVTVGKNATKRFEELEAAGEYAEGYYLHGLAVQMAEATANYMHEHIRRELGLEPNRGKRYSWGYPAIPELEDHVKVFELLPAESALGMTLTAAYQLVPEQSTAAIIVHHPDAKYFNVGTSRVEQLLGD